MRMPISAMVGFVLSICSLASVGQTPANPYAYSRLDVFERDPVTGWATAAIAEPDLPQQCVRVEYGYDAFGNRRATTTRNCTGASGTALFTTRVHTEDHGAYGSTPSGLAPTVVTNAEGHVERREYDTRYGDVLVAVDENSLATTVTYDGFGRKTLEIRPDGNRTSWTYEICSAFGGGGGDCSIGADGAVVSYYIRETPQNAAGQTNGPVQTTFFDTEGRKVLVATDAYAAGGMRQSITRYRYDALGRLDRETGPYFDGDAALEWVEREYDVLDRVVLERRPNPSAAGQLALNHTDFNGRFVVQTNPLGQTLTKEHNELDQVIRVTDTRGSQISYQHDAFGNIAVIRDPLGNVSQLTYDFRGHKVRVDDPNMGVWVYDVDPLGQVVRQTSPKNLITTTQYDRIGRMVRRLESDLDSSWYFDRTAAGSACGSSIGELCEATTTTGYRRLHTYDSMSRLARTATTLASGSDGTFVSKVDYNTDGRVDRQIWPTGFALQNVYNGQGVLTELRNAASSALYWQRHENNARGEIVRALTGNSLIGHTTWQPETATVAEMGVGTAASPSSVARHSYSYNALNNLTQRVDHVHGLTEGFGYDSLNRIESQTVQSPHANRNVTYRYDALGNVTFNSEVGSYSYGAAQGSTPRRPHAVRSVSGQVGKLVNPVYSYDAHGNIETVVGSNGITRTHTWTSFDMPQSLTLSQDGVGSSFLYGPEHQRARQTITRNGQSRTILYLHPGNDGTLYFERELQGTGGVATNRHYVSTEKGTFLQIETPGSLQSDPVASNLAGLQQRYWHKDHLGSLVAITDSTGAVLERLGYEPFGKRRHVNGVFDAPGAIDAVQTKRGFTGHEHLDELDYIHMNGRIYDPDIARFLSPDPTVPFLHHLQSFNRYSYTRNNPLNRLDPTGFTDGASGTGSSGEAGESLGNSLSGPAVSKGIAELGKGNAKGPGQQGDTAGPKAQPSTAEAIERQTQEIEEGTKKAVKAGILGALSLWGPSKLAGLWGRVFAGRKAAQVANAAQDAVDKGEQVANAAQAVQGAINTPSLERVEIVGVREQPPSRKTSSGIGVTIHSVHQKINRGVTTAAELDALKAPLKKKPIVIDHLGRPSQKHIGRKAEVAINPVTGNIVSVNPTSTKKAERLSRSRE
jgi:RHS repeat-associated protein